MARQGRAGNRLLRWSTLNQRVFALTALDAFLAGRGVTEPRLDADPARVRQLMQDFLSHVRASRTTRGPTRDSGHRRRTPTLSNGCYAAQPGNGGGAQ